MSDLPEITPSWRDQPNDVPWPTTTWPRGAASRDVDALVGEAFTNPLINDTTAVLVVRGGRVIAERYGGELVHFDRPSDPITASTPLLSWSMAKSMLHYLVGLLVDAGELDPAARAPVHEWADDSDPRSEITLGDLLAMRDGLDFVEDYVDGDVSDVIEMLFGSGQDDVAGYTVARPLAHPPGTVFNYSSGTTNVISRIVADRVGAGDAYRDFIQRRLFDPLGMSSASARLDGAGVFIASSFVYATAQDFARFGLLYLRGGRWDDRQLVSREWTATAQLPLSVDEEPESFYSWQWWVRADDYGTYWMNGYEGQMIVISPALDSIIVRLGRTPATSYDALRDWRGRLIEALAR